MKSLISPLKFIVLSLIFSVGCAGNSSDKEEAPGNEDLQALAKELAIKFIIADTHVDIPYRLRAEMEDISIRTKKGDFDMSGPGKVVWMRRLCQYMFRRNMKNKEGAKYLLIP